MKRVVVLRTIPKPDRLLGYLSVFDAGVKVLDQVTLELPWKGNRKQESCIPAGLYKINPEKHATKGLVLRLESVPGRSGVLMHKGCFPRNTLGCVLVGTEFADLDGDKVWDAADSRKAMKALFDLITEPALLQIVDAY